MPHWSHWIQINSFFRNEQFVFPLFGAAGEQQDVEDDAAASEPASELPTMVPSADSGSTISASATAVPSAASTSTQATSATTAVSGAVLTAASEITRVVLPAARRCRGRPKGTNKSLNTKLSAKRKKCRDDSVIDSTICYLCMCDEPAKKLMRGAIIEWTRCSGNCERWFHDVCISNIGATVQGYTCNHC